jgi:hypothetical protein
MAMDCVNPLVERSALANGSGWLLLYLNVGYVVRLARVRTVCAKKQVTDLRGELVASIEVELGQCTAFSLGAASSVLSKYTSIPLPINQTQSINPHCGDALPDD